MSRVVEAVCPVAVPIDLAVTGEACLPTLEPVGPGAYRVTIPVRLSLQAEVAGRAKVTEHLVNATGYVRFEPGPGDGAPLLLVHRLRVALPLDLSAEAEATGGELVAALDGAALPGRGR